MFSNDDPAVYLERAAMHQQLAAATDDIPARKMHLAMAAEYRRRAEALIASTARMDVPHPTMELRVAAR